MSRAAAARCWCRSCSISPIRRSSWRPGRTESRASRLVFITRNIPEQQVRDLFAAVRALGSRRSTPTELCAGVVPSHAGWTASFRIVHNHGSDVAGDVRPLHSSNAIQGDMHPWPELTLDVNGKAHTIDADPDMPLLYALRNDIGLNNPHFGCGLAQCGACTVHLDGQPIRSCVTPVSAVGDGKVVTLAGLGTPEKPHPLQTAYVEEQVPQCGYCINGWIMTAAAFLRDKKKPTDAEIKYALEGAQMPLRHACQHPAARSSAPPTMMG